MKIDFRVLPHSSRPDTNIVEVLADGITIACLYPGDHAGVAGVKLVSAHIEHVDSDDGSTSIPPIPAVTVTFDPKPWTIVDGRLVRLKAGE